MNKAVPIVLAGIVVVGGVYWLSTRDKVTPSESSDNATETPVVNETVGTATDSSGGYITDKSGFTLYVNQRDENSAGQIIQSCNATCEQSWIPYLLAEGEVAQEASADPVLSKLNLFTRTDGKIQYALGTKPLYRYIGDEKYGDIKGSSITDWVIARP